MPLARVPFADRGTHDRSTFGPKGRFLCVAVSNDTLSWTKPVLNNVAFENSTANSEPSPSMPSSSPPAASGRPVRSSCQRAY
jgi:hypothetical protein